MYGRRRVDNQIAVSIQPDTDGLTGRECPNPICEGYFKVECGTGLHGDNLPCHCPYCGHTAAHDDFWTKEQIEYAKSIALRQMTGDFQRELKKLEFEHKPKRGFGLGISLKVKTGPLPLIRHYREKELETEIICGNCTLRYMVYGVFAFCPDCGQHNSLQILSKNFELAAKMLDMAATAVHTEMAIHLIENALEDCVSAFDGFGREICRVYANKLTDPAKAEKVTFQNLEGARKNLINLWGVDLAIGVDASEWQVAVKCFQKRHLIAHKMGVIDTEYIAKTGDPHAVVGRKAHVNQDDVRQLVPVLAKIAQAVFSDFMSLP